MVERSYGWWEKILRVLQASETLKEYKPWRILRVLQTSETQKGVQVMQIGLWDSKKSTSRREYLLVSQCCVKHFFELKKSFFLCSFWCMSIYLLYFLLEWARLLLVIEQTNVFLFRWRVTICCLLFLALNEQILYGTISFKRVKRIVLEDEELLGE